MIFDLAERLDPRLLAAGRDMREQSVSELQRRFAVDRDQAGRVQRIAQRLHAQLAPKAEEEHRRELGWAAALHEIGMMVSHHDHHRHSAYLLSHVDAPGFSQNQLRRLGDLALGQRGGLRKLEEQLQEEPMIWQLLALRLAAIKCHARSEVDATAIKLRREGMNVIIEMRKGWAEAHPRAHYLLREELDAWGKVGRVQLALEA